MLMIQLSTSLLAATNIHLIDLKGLAIFIPGFLN